MPKINMQNVNRIIEKHKSLYRDMLKKHYKPLLAKFVEELMQELKIENYSIDYGLDDSEFIHLKIFNNVFCFSHPCNPYGYNKYKSNTDNWKLLGYINSGQYDKEKELCQKQKLK